MEKTICIFGDSSVWGAWDHEKGGWVNRLRLFLEVKDDEITVYNLGVSGDTTNELLERFDAEAKAREPSIIIFSIGGNDSIYIKSKNKQMVSLQEFENNLKMLIKKAKKFTKTIIFLGCDNVDESKTSPIPWETDYYYTNKNLLSYNRKIKEIAEKNKCYYLDSFNLFSKDDLDEDGLHPNDKGHQKLFLKLKEFIVKKNILA